MHLYGLIIGIAIVIGISFFSARNLIIPKKQENIFIIGILVFAVIGARAYHVIDQWSFYSQNLWLIPQTWKGGLGIFGGILGGMLFLYLYSRLTKFSFLSIIDTIIPILPLCQAIGRFGNFINGENPIWWPEAILDLCLFLFIFKFPKNPTAKYLIGYGLIRFLTEFWRTDTWVINNLKIGQLISIVFIVIGVSLIYRARLKITQNHY
jgi:phosphatidylglycerol:prolipoprotein diacylglycerol transferase